jgi:hypothetical protein
MTTTLTDAFRALGLSESEAAHAATGRGDVSPLAEAAQPQEDHADRFAPLTPQQSKEAIAWMRAGFGHERAMRIARGVVPTLPAATAAPLSEASGWRRGSSSTPRLAPTGGTRLVPLREPSDRPATPSTSTSTTPQQTTDVLETTFRVLGLSESEAKIAAQGR